MAMIYISRLREEVRQEMQIRQIMKKYSARSSDVKQDEAIMKIIGKSQRGGGQNVSYDFLGKTYCGAPPPKLVLEGSESGIGLVCARFPQGKWQGASKGGWKRIIGGGGSKTVFGEGFYGMFSPPLSFPTPFVFL